MRQNKDGFHIFYFLWRFTKNVDFPSKNTGSFLEFH